IPNRNLSRSPPAKSPLLPAPFLGGRIRDLAAGINVISRIRALRIPKAVKRPKDWNVFSLKVRRDAKLAAATTPAVIITGPILVRDSTTDCLDISAPQWLSPPIASGRRLKPAATVALLPAVSNSS